MKIKLEKQRRPRWITRALDAEAMGLAGRAHIRHACRRYDDSLAAQYEGREAPQAVRGEAEGLLPRWSETPDR